MSNHSINQREAQNCSIVGSNKKIIYSNIVMNLSDGYYLELPMMNSRIWFERGKKQDVLFPQSEGEKQGALSPRLEEGLLFPPQEKWESSNYSDILRIIPSDHIGRFQPPEQRNSSQCQHHGQELAKNGGLSRALPNHTGLKSDRVALVQLQNSRLAISRLFGTILNNAKGFKFVETLKVTFVKRKDDNNI